MLDEPNYIAQFDRSNGLGMIAGQADQLRHQFEVEAPVVADLRNIVLAGMGGSALAAEFIRSWLGDRLPIPFEIVRDYTMPAYVGEHTLIIASSYSGNTEETLSFLDQAEKFKSHIIIITSGGKLSELAESRGHALMTVPTGLQPRLAVFYSVKALATVIEHLGLVDGITDELETNAEWLLEEINSFIATVPEADNIAKQVAKRLVGHPIVVYGGPSLAFPAMKWKIDINENAKNVAFWNQVPEYNHNEFIGWAHPKDTLLQVVQLQSSLDGERVKKRFEVSNKLLSGTMPAPIIVEAHGQTKLQQMLWTLLLGDFISAYLAFLNKIDPIPVELIEKLKKELG
ncbi:MAG TPA: bifunctional phosphoglucose/phosphomannose isomerase [Candidatus Saccharimonadales bacterium]|nr:bifunctional phosphoglucose/phosphomannose isomerase [Candidatus Saccharimonadales bacterium]